MPISFEQPGPGRVYNSNQQALSEQYAAQTQQNTQLALANASRMQQDRQAANGAMQQRDQFAAQNAYSPRDQGQAQAQMALQAQHGQIQSQLQQEDFSHGDDVRLSQLNQAKASIVQQEADGQISIPERDQMLTQLYTGDRGINVLKNRQEATQTKAQQQHIDQMQSQMQIAEAAEKRKAAADDDTREFNAAKIQGKVKEVPHAYKVEEFAKQIAKDLPNWTPQQVRAEAEDQARAGGHFSTFYINEKGVPIHAKEIDAARQQQMVGQDGEPATGGKGKSAGATAVKDFDTLTARSKANADAHKLASEGLLPADQIGKKSQELYDQFRSDHQAHIDEGQQSKTNRKAAPFDVADPATGTPQQRKAIDRIDVTKQQVNDRADLPGDVKFAAIHQLNTAARLQAKWSLPNGALDPKTPAHVHKELANIDKFIKSIPAIGPQSAPAQPPQQAAQPAAPPPNQWGQGVGQDLGNVKRYIGNQIPTQQDMRNSMPSGGRLGRYLRDY